MPLKSGHSDATVSQNIRTELHQFERTGRIGTSPPLEDGGGRAGGGHRPEQGRALPRLPGGRFPARFEKGGQEGERGEPAPSELPRPPRADLDPSNGLIHAIDTVRMPSWPSPRRP
jgi:hypothetical protein